MLKQVPAKCPRRRIWSGTPLPGCRARRAGRPTPHTLSLFPPSRLQAPRAFKQFQTRRLFSRPVIQISFLRMAMGTDSSGLYLRRRKLSHANCMHGALGYVLHPRTHKMWKACVRVRCGAHEPNLLLSIFPCRSIYSRVYHSILIFPWCTREYKK